MKKHSVLTVLFIVMVVFFCGCAGPQRNIQLQAELPDTAMLEKSPLKVALYIPDSTRNYTQATEIKSRCGFHDRGWAPARYGEVFAETAQGTLSQVFQKVTPIGRPVEGGHDLIIQAELNELGYKPGCRPDPATYFVLKGTFRAVDTNGVEIWRSPLTSKKVEASIGERYKLDTIIPGAIASMVGSWTQQLLTAPEIKKRSGSR
ncbi:MAG: hypothetical protein NTV58_09645 [Deltaproteobacteria bacterium]|nr:hypothetical protein [Deltaproteobacteria bacterium]